MLVVVFFTSLEAVFFPLPKMTSTMWFASSTLGWLPNLQDAPTSQKKISKCPQVPNQILKANHFFRDFRNCFHSLPSELSFDKKVSAELAFFEVQTLRSDEYALGLCQVKGVECTALQVWKPGGWLVVG